MRNVLLLRIRLESVPSTEQPIAPPKLPAPSGWTGPSVGRQLTVQPQSVSSSGQRESDETHRRDLWFHSGQRRDRDLCRPAPASVIVHRRTLLRR